MLFRKRAHKLGILYQDGEPIIHQGGKADSFFVILEGRVEVLIENDSTNNSTPERLAILEKGTDDVFGEMACFDDLPRSASVRALGSARVLTIERREFLQWIDEDPSMVFKILKTMSTRIRTLNEEVIRLRKQR